MRKLLSHQNIKYQKKIKRKDDIYKYVSIRSKITKIQTIFHDKVHQDIPPAVQSAWMPRG